MTLQQINTFLQIEILAEEKSSGNIGISFPDEIRIISEDYRENLENKVDVLIVREGGLYGSVELNWEIYPDQPNTFEIVKGRLYKMIFN